MSDYIRGKGAHDLAERCLRLDPKAWEELVASHRRVVLRVLTRILGTGDPAIIQDLEQETYERLLQRDCEALRAVEGPRHLRALLCTIAANLARDHLRRSAVREAHLQAESLQAGEALFESPPLPAELFARKEDLERISKALEKVLKGPNARRDAQIFRAYFFEGETASEIAAMGLGLSTKGVETVLLRLVRKLRESMRT